MADQIVETVTGIAGTFRIRRENNGREIYRIIDEHDNDAYAVDVLGNSVGFACVNVEIARHYAVKRANERA